jgi:hypothetical protein
MSRRPAQALAEVAGRGAVNGTTPAPPAVHAFAGRAHWQVSIWQVSISVPRP